MELECPACGQPLDAMNIGYALVDTKVPFARCHACHTLVRIDLREPNDDETEEWRNWEAGFLGEVG